MIVNMSDSGGNGLASLDTTAQGQCDFNFLKRKLDDEASLANQQINNDNGSASAEIYQGSADNVWKKRHIEDTTTSVNTTSACFSESNFTTSALSEYNTNNGNPLDSTTNGGSSNNGDMAFSLIGNSFMNDFFAYDANLIVPVSANSSSSSGSLGGAPTMPTFTTPTTVCVNGNAFDDGSSWQATDLLELDHRYNSGLQTEIAQLNPTVALKSMQEPLLTATTLQEQSAPEENFLVPQRQVSRSSIRTASPTKDQPAQPEQLTSTQTPATPAEGDSDFEDKNLSWLLNFKFDELPHLSPDVGGNTANSAAGGKSKNSAGLATGGKTNSNLPSSTSTNSAQANQAERSRSPKGSTKAGKKFEELVMEVTSELDGNDMIVAENVIVEETTSKAPKKPPFTYTELIEYALEDKGELTVSGIYQWISDRFPYYKSNDDRWKNSVRHNLSINPHFRKGVKAPQGAGHLWTISSGDSAENVLAWEHKKQRLDLFFKLETLNRERLQQHQQQLQQQQQCTSPHDSCQQDQCLYDEAAAAAAAITQEMMQQQHHSSHENQRLGTHMVHELPFNDLLSDEELRKTAGQILNGIHREVEVQSVNSIIGTYHDVLLDNEDYLNPIAKDVAVNESGLRHSNAVHTPTSSQYYVTDIDPMELGIHMTHQVEEEVLFNDEFNLNYFGYNAGNDIVA